MSEVQIPEGWVWKKLGDVVSEGQVGVVKPNSEQNTIGNGVPYIKMNNIDLNGSINTSSLVYVEASQTELHKYTLQDGDILVNTRNSLELVGKTGMFKHVAQPVLYNNNLLRLRFVTGVLPSYMNYQMTSPVFRRLLTQSKKATTNICAIYQKDLLALNVLIPPLPVQQAIVARIEELFSELEDGVRELKTALARLKTYRQAVLQHYLNNPDWELVNSGDLFDYVTSGSRGWAEFYSSEGAVFLRITNLDFNTLNLDLEASKIQHVKLTGVKEGLRTRVKPGDFLVSITGYLGMFAIVPDDIPEAYVNQHIALCRPKDGFNKQFVGYFMISQTGGIRQLNKMQKGATKAGLSLVDIKSVKIPLPDLATQAQIVSEIEALLSGADDMETTIRQELIRAENLRQSILKQAFAGQLVTTPFDGPGLRQVVTEDLSGIPVPSNPVHGGQGDQLTLF